MVVSCSACDEQYGVTEDVTFHKFPANEERRKKWVKAVQRPAWIPGKRSMLCSKHFSPDKFVYKISGDKIRRYLLPDTVPTIFDRTNRKLRNGELRQLDGNSAVSSSNLDCLSNQESVELKFVEPGTDAPLHNVAANSTGNLNLEILAEVSVTSQIAAEPEEINPPEKNTSNIIVKALQVPGAALIPIAGTSSSQFEENQETRITNLPGATQRSLEGKYMKPDLSSLPKRVRQTYPGDFKHLNYTDVMEVSRSWSVLNNYIKKMRRNMKALQQRNRRLGKRVTDLKSVVKFLKNRIVERDSAAVKLCGHSDSPGATASLYKEDVLQRVTSNPLQDHNYISAKDETVL